MNVIEYIFKKTNKQIYVNDNDGGDGNFVSLYNMSIIIETIDLIDEYFKNNNLKEIVSMNNYIDYLFLNYMFSPVDMIQKRKETKKYFKFVSDMRSNYDDLKGKVCKYINVNYEDIYNYEYDELLKHSQISDITSTFAFKYSLKNVMKYIINEDFLFINVYSNTEYMKKAMQDFRKDDTVMNKLFSPVYIENYFFNNDLTEFSDVFIKLKYIDHELYENVMETLKKLYNKIYEIYIEGENLLFLKNKTNQFVSVFKKLKHNYTDTLISKNKEIKQKLNSYIEINGKHYLAGYNVNIDDIDILLKNSPTDLLKSIVIDGDNITVIERVLESVEGVIDLSHFVTLVDMPTNEFFGYKEIKALLEMSLRNYSIINSILMSKLGIDAIINFLKTSLYEKFDEIAFYSREQIDKDMDFLKDAMKELMLKATSSNETSKFTIYGVGCVLLGITERVTKKIYELKNLNENYFDKDYLTIGKLYDDTIIRKEVGEKNAQVILYYLTKLDGVGKNYRNIFCHFDESVYEHLEMHVISDMLFLLLTIVEKTRSTSDI